MPKLLLAVALLAPAMLFAQTPFDGTWKEVPDQSKFSGKPMTFSLSNGMYDSTSAGTKIHVKADGQDQPVSGLPYNTIAIKEVDAHTVQSVTKKNGKIVYEQTRTVSDDGKTVTLKNTNHQPDSDQTTTDEWTLERVGEAPKEAHATSGSWRIQKVTEPENRLLETYRTSGDELTWSNPTGESWTAKLDGKDYPVKGSYRSDSVSLKRVNDRTIEESYKRRGELVFVNKRTVSPDGKKMTSVGENKRVGRASTSIAEKQ